jgi:DNA-binding NarL/FixJ family response regulator
MGIRAFQMAVSKVKPLRLMLVESHPYIRERVHNLLDQDAAFDILADCASGLQAVSEALRLKPDLILTDLRLDDSNGLALARVIGRLLPQTSVVLLTGPQPYGRAASESGIREVVAKGELDVELIPALRRVRDAMHTRT